MVSQSLVVLPPEPCENPECARVHIATMHADSANETHALTGLAKLRMQVHTASWKGTVGGADCVTLTLTSAMVGEQPDKAHDGAYVTRGMLYAKHDGIWGVSCGGLLASLEFSSHAKGACPWDDLYFEGDELLIVIAPQST